MNNNKLMIDRDLKEFIIIINKYTVIVTILQYK